MENSNKPTTYTLAKLEIGESATVSFVDGNTSISKRLMEMGIVPGASVKLVKAAPFGCPLQISVRGYHLAIRRTEAEKIGIEK